jgi:hypothetical protein
MEVGGLAASAIAFGWLGTSATAWRGVPLPLDLTFAGAPGCQLLAAPESVRRLGVAAGTALWVEPIPLRVPLIGATLAAQAGVAANGALATSNAGGILVGPH